MPNRVTKEYQDPHAKLKAALALLLASALGEKRRLLLAYIADHGTDGLLDYADTVLDAGWDQHFDEAAAILAAAAVDGTIDVLDKSEIDFSDEFVANIEKHNDLIAKTQAASLLGLVYDVTRDVAIPALIGWSIGEELLTQLDKTVTRIEQDAVAREQAVVSAPSALVHEELSATAKLDQAIAEMAAFSSGRAEQMAHNALKAVDGAAARATSSAAGATLKRSMTVGDDKVCADCDQNMADGWIGINDAFSGSDSEDVPHHPNCRCTVEYDFEQLPVLQEAA